MVNTQLTSTRKLCFELLRTPKDELLSLLADRASYYRPYVQKKTKTDGSAKPRDIEPPYGYLKIILKKIDANILQPAISELPTGVMGGRKGCSVVDNANLHAKSKALMKYDIKDFFPSIKYTDVYHTFRYQLSFTEEAANILAHLTTYESKKHGVHVPQGSPTSMSLANLAISNLSIQLDVYCKNNGMIFSSWVDDITVSGDVETLKLHKAHIDYLVNSTHFKIHPEKNIGIVKKGMKAGGESGRRVTGVVITNDNQLSIGHKKLSRLRKQVNKAKQPSDKLRGRIQFLKQVSPRHGRKLMHQYKNKFKTDDIMSTDMTRRL